MAARPGRRRSGVRPISTRRRGPTPGAWRLAIVAIVLPPLRRSGGRASPDGSRRTADELGLGSGWATGLTATFWAGFLGGRLLMTWRGERIDTGDVLCASVIAATVIAIVMRSSARRRSPLLIVSTCSGCDRAAVPDDARSPAPGRAAHRYRHRVVHCRLRGRWVDPAADDRRARSIRSGAAAMPWTIAIASVASAVVLLAIDRWALVLPGMNGGTEAPIPPTRHRPEEGYPRRHA